MAAHLSFLLFLTGLTGIYSLRVSKVSVKAGESITIPCHYESKYINHVKYLCEGYYWRSCSYVVKTNQPHSSGKFSISDDKNQRIFNVTIKNLRETDSDYWCIVEINNGGDVGEYFHLSVTTGTPSLFVDNQEITGFNGERITINCNYSNSGVKRWCKLGGSCVTESGSIIDGTSVTINTQAHNVFTVTMSGLTAGSSGWYVCVNGDFQMPVHVTVTEKPPTTTPPETHSPSPNPMNLTSVSVDKRVSVDLKILIIALSLIVVLMMTVFIWFMLKRNKKTEADSSATATRTDAESDGDVTYSSVVIVKQQTARKVEAKAEDVTYSTVARHQQNL